MKKIIFLFIDFLIALQLFAQNPLDNFIKCPLLENANISVLVKDLNTNQTLYDFRSKCAATPASTMKLVTTAAAMEIAGPNVSFLTLLAVDGEISKDSVLSGNLYIFGGCDPTLGSAKLGDKDFLSKWVLAVKNAGIKKITGQVIADGGILGNEGVNPHWTWEDIGNYYAAGVYGLTYMDNTCKVILRSGREGTKPEILRTIPEIKGLTFDNQLKSTKISYDSAYFYGAPHSNVRIIRGEIPANNPEFVIKCDIPNPELLLAQHFHTKLIESGVSIAQEPTDIVKNNYTFNTIFQFSSPPLSQIISETNIHSNNLFAENIFRYLGLNKKIENTVFATQNIKSFWKSKGLPTDQLFQVDGCGLSPSNAVSAEFLVDLLTSMNKSQNKELFFNSLPVSGETGTLSNFLKNTDLEGKVHAKSGTISRVKSYAGYLETTNKKLVFALIVNNANGGSKEVTKKIEEFLLEIAK
jgi:serine-type D-Ala-D-Ala carboxypeptidase/endopeptidase (penicillin-binding protein 4)